MMSLWDALRMNMMISYQELVRTFLSAVPGRYDNSQRDDDLPDRLAETGDAAYATKAEDNRNTVKRITHQPSPQTCGSAK